jgi:nucleoside-diphosphate-sugar epimerase
MTDWHSRRVLVTGGLGCVGSSLAHRLVAAGADVTLLDARLPHLGSNPANVAGIRDDVTVVEGDVRDADLVAEHVRGSDVVYHCAAQNDRGYARDHPGEDVDINAKGTLNVLEAAAARESPPRVVFTSSLAVYGHVADPPVDESTPVDPMDLYGAHKVAAEHYCDIYAALDDVPTTVARLANVYGPRAAVDRGYGVQAIFPAQAVRDETITVFEPGDALRDLVHVDDVVAALELLGTDDRALGGTYVLGTGDPTTLLELAETAVDVAGTGEVELVPWPEEWATLDRGDVYTDPARLRDLGWAPAVDLREGLCETVAFYREHREAYL